MPTASAAVTGPYIPAYTRTENSVGVIHCFSDKTDSFTVKYGRSEDFSSTEPHSPLEIKAEMDTIKSIPSETK